MTGTVKHYDDKAVDIFASAMKEKLAAAREKGRGGWNDPAQCSVEFLAELLLGHVSKGNAGNFEDIANLAMMLYMRGADPAILSALTTDPRALVAAALERAAEKVRPRKRPPEEIRPEYFDVIDDVLETRLLQIRALIDTDHAAALEAVREQARAEERMFLLAEAEEKAACIPAYAKIGPDGCWEPGSPWDRGYQAGCKAVAAAIRARGESE